MITSNETEKMHGLILNAGFQDSMKSVIKYAIERERGGGRGGEREKERRLNGRGGGETKYYKM